VIRAAYLAAEGFEQPLLEELTRHGIAISAWHGRLALSPDLPARAARAAWALETWTAPSEHDAVSVKGVAGILRAIQRNWAAYPVTHHRRMALITAQLPPVRARELVFPEAAPASHLGAWTLLDQDRLLLSPTTTSAVPGGEWRFIEDHIGPPSRAYLKLWEALTRLGVWPQPGERCIDLGAAPGGWTWVLAQLGATVLAVDKAALDPRVLACAGVTAVAESAFAMAPQPAEWLFSDVIAYPARLLELVRRWIEAGCVQRIICTVKFQGETDHVSADAFAAIPGGDLMHLSHNKHELTFIWASPTLPLPAGAPPAGGRPAG